jgi:hypothetical protein
VQRTAIRVHGLYGQAGRQFGVGKSDLIISNEHLHADFGTIRAGRAIPSPTTRDRQQRHEYNEPKLIFTHDASQLAVRDI